MHDESRGLATAVWVSSADGLIVVDARGAIVAANPAAVRALAESGAGLEGRLLETLLVPRGLGPLADVLASAGTEGWRGEMIAAAPGAEQGVWELTLAPLQDGTGRLAGVLRDVRAWYARERERQGLLSAVLHDVKGLLTVILGYAELLTDPADTPTRAVLVDTLGRVAECGEQIHALLSNFGLFWRLEAGPLVVERQAVDLVDLVDRVVRQHAPRAERAGVALRVELPAALEAVGDRTQLERAIGNLVTNAVKFSPAKGQVTVRLGRDDGEIVLTVVDNGPGLPAGDVEQLFVKHRTRVPGRRGEGIGLGLPVARGIARAHGGELTLAAGERGGAIAMLRLPAPAPTTSS